MAYWARCTYRGSLTYHILGEASLKRLVELFQDVKFLRRFHGIAVLIWMALVIPTLIWWKDSILWVAMMSIWANVVGHWASWQGARAEDAEREDAKKEEKKS